MPAALDEIVTLAGDAVFRSRCKAAVIRAAALIVVEINSAGTASAVDKQRRDLCLAVINDLDAYAERFVWVLAQIPSVSAATTDEQLIQATRNVWNHLARLPM